MIAASKEKLTKAEKQIKLLLTKVGCKPSLDLFPVPCTNCLTTLPVDISNKPSNVPFNIPSHTLVHTHIPTHPLTHPITLPLPPPLKDEADKALALEVVAKLVKKLKKGKGGGGAKKK